MARNRKIRLVFSIWLAIIERTLATTFSELGTSASLVSFPESLTALPSGSAVTYPTIFAPNCTIASSNGTPLSLDRACSSASLNLTASESTTELSGSKTTAASIPTTATSGPACNGYPELCHRKYSNVTFVMAHNSPFVVPNNAASNQEFKVTIQLNDGIRGLEFETHKPNASSPMMLCHTSCDELNVGPLEDYLTTIRQWLDQNRYEVVTIVMGNDDFVEPTNYVDPFKNSGMLDYVYVPEAVSMGLSGWPTLGEMIVTNKRVVVMLDYKANQTEIPWLLEQWNYLFQTPFSPVNPEFPCTAQRPPNQPRDVSVDRLYTANHNLNLPIKIKSLGVDILVPYWPQLPNTNANYTNVEGAAGTMIDNCTATWGRPPNFLLVDYYNYGNFNGSTLAAGAEANNVSYNVESCCGLAKPYTSSGERKLSILSPSMWVAAAVSIWMYIS